MKTLLRWLCVALVVAAVGTVFAAGKGKGILEDPFTDEQAQVARRIDEMVDAAQKLDVPRIESLHAYGPKFSKFEDDGLGRQDAETSRKDEAQSLRKKKALAFRVERLKVDVFGQTAVATFELAYDVDNGKDRFVGRDRGTLVFVKDGADWKIVHEHFSRLGP